MAETSTQRAAAVESILTATASDTPAVREAALKALVPIPDQGTANKLWQYLVVGLLVLTGAALIGLLVMIGDGKESTSPDLVVTAFTALLTGLLGLFIKSPVDGN